MKQVFLAFGERPQVKNASWVIQVYEMSGVSAQTWAANLVSSVGALTVDTRICERGAFLVVECSEANDALKVYEMVMMADSHAELIYSTGSPSEAQAVRERMRPNGESAPLSEGDRLDA